MLLYHTFHPCIILLYGSYTSIPISCFCTDLMLSSLYHSSVWTHTSPLDPQCQSLFPHDASVNFQQATALDVTGSWANRRAASACVNPNLGHMFHVKHMRSIDSIVYIFSIFSLSGFFDGVPAFLGYVFGVFFVLRIITRDLENSELGRVNCSTRSIFPPSNRIPNFPSLSSSSICPDL